MNTLGPSIPVNASGSKTRSEGADSDAAGFADAFDGAFGALGPRPAAPASGSASASASPPASASGNEAIASVEQGTSRSIYGLAQSEGPMVDPASASGLEQKPLSVQALSPPPRAVAPAPASIGHASPASKGQNPAPTAVAPGRKAPAAQRAAPPAPLGAPGPAAVDDALPASKGQSSAPIVVAPGRQAPTAPQAALQIPPQASPQGPAPQTALQAALSAPSRAPNPSGGATPEGGVQSPPQGAPRNDQPAQPAQTSLPKGVTASPVESPGLSQARSVGEPRLGASNRPEAPRPPASPVAHSLKGDRAPQPSAREPLVVEFSHAQQARGPQDGEGFRTSGARTGLESPAPQRSESPPVEALLRGDVRRGAEVLLRGARTPTSLSAASALRGEPGGSGAKPAPSPRLEGLKPTEAKALASPPVFTAEPRTLARVSFDQRLAQASPAAGGLRLLEPGASQGAPGANGSEPSAPGPGAVSPAFDIRPPSVAPLAVESRMGPALLKDLQQQFATLDEGTSRTVELRLDPPELGRVTVRISMVGDEARVAFTAAQGGAREALEAALPKLREMFEQAGLSLGEAQVGTGSGQDSRGRGQASEGVPGVAGASATDQEALEDAQVPEVVRVNSPARGRLDLRV